MRVGEERVSIQEDGEMGGVELEESGKGLAGNGIGEGPMAMAGCGRGRTSGQRPAPAPLVQPPFEPEDGRVHARTRYHHLHPPDVPLPSTPSAHGIPPPSTPTHVA